MSEIPDPTAAPPFHLTRGDFFFLLLLAAGLLGTYWSVFLRYGYLDDYFWLDLALNRPGDIFPPQARQGRPINGWLLPWMFQFAGSIGGLRRLRVMTVLEIALLGWVLSLALIRAGWNRAAARPLAAMACLLPAMQVYAAWASSVTVPLSGIAAVLAAMATGNAQDGPRLRRGSWSLAVLLVFISATIYQPTAMIFWPVAAIDLLRPDRRPKIFRRLTIYILTAAAGLFLAWCVLKYGLIHYPKAYSPKRDSLTLHPLDKLSWFFHAPLVDSLNLFRLRPSIDLAIAIAAILFIGLLGLYGWRALTVAVILIPLSYLPNLLVQESWSSYRTQVGLSWLILILVALVICRIGAPRRLLAGLLVFAALAAAEIASPHVAQLIAIPQVTELNLLTWSLTSADDTPILLLQPTGDNRYAAYTRYDEFGRTSLEVPWVPPSEINLLRDEQKPGAPRVDVQLEPDFHGPRTHPDGVFVIDMRGLSR